MFKRLKLYLIMASLLSFVTPARPMSARAAVIRSSISVSKSFVEIRNASFAAVLMSTMFFTLREVNVLGYRSEAHVPHFNT